MFTLINRLNRTCGDCGNFERDDYGDPDYGTCEKSDRDGVVHENDNADKCGMFNK